MRVPSPLRLTFFKGASRLALKNASKTRPVPIYNTSGQDVIALPITSNENKNGSSKGNSKPWVVEVKLEKHSLIKVSKPMTINKNALFKFFGIQASTKIRRKVRDAFNNWVVLKELRK